MARAIMIAEPFHPHPNPRVGCVLVNSGEVVGEGAHQSFGTNHAETRAIEAAGDRSIGATAFVTLEPCSHHGATPPCADALIAAQVQRVVVGVRDPDARVSGNGIDRLRSSGIEVAIGVLESESIDLDPGYHHHRATGRPRVHVVLTQSVSGGLSDAANGDLDRLRGRLDYVVGGAGDLLHHPSAIHVALTDQLATLGADGIVDLGVRDDPELVGALAEADLIDAVTIYSTGEPEWGPVGSGTAFTITSTDTIGPEIRRDARRTN